MSEKDHLSGEIAIEASLTESGIKASAKSRFVSAVDRLFGGVFDIPAAFLEGHAARIRLEDQMDRNAREDRKSLALRGEMDLQKLEQAAALSKRHQEIRETLNKAAVFVEALEDFSSTDSGQQDSQIEIEDDWINVFGSYAAKASSDRLRQLWGKILSGEIRKPGSFSLTTLRVLSELDQQTAVLFQKYAEGVIDDSFIIKQGELKGETLIELTFLEEVGLLQEVNGSLGVDQNYDTDGVWNFEYGNLGLLANGSPNGTFRINLIKISRAGKEILSILPTESPDISLRKIAKLAEETATSIALILVTGRPGPGKISYQVIEKLK